MKNILSALLLSITISTVAAVHNVRSYGAKGDSTQIDSPSINLAIEAAAADGGGTIYLPAGKYLCYTIRLQSNITIYLENGATIIAAFPSSTQGYDEAEPNENNPYQDFGHSHWHNSLMWADGCSNITICGSGTINGAGLTREESRLKGVGNKAISLRECKNVLIRDIKMLRCGHFAVLATGVDNLTITNLLVDTNRDGFDIDCCRNVRISHCSVNSPWDDAIVVKSSYGLKYFRDSENITINNCYVSGFNIGSAMDATWQTDEPQAPDHGGNCGRIKIGTESSGGFKNIIISDCIFDHCRGLALETVDGGVMEDVIVSNIVMRDIVNSPIFLRLGARCRSPKGTLVGAMRRISINNISVQNAKSEYSCILSGIPSYSIEDVSISNVNIAFQGGYTAADAAVVPPENESVYPEPWMFGRIPASGFYIRHVNNILLNNIRFQFKNTDERPLFGGYNVNNIDVGNVWCNGQPVDNIKL